MSRLLALCPVLLLAFACPDSGSGGTDAGSDGGIPGDGGLPPLTGGSALGALAFTVNAAGDHDYGHLVALPPGFGEGEFTFELWIQPDPGYPVGPITPGTPEQLTRWSSTDSAPYSSGSWWYEGNFLLDGHNNASFQDGTFSLQSYGAGRFRWLFGDGATAGPGGHWSIGAYPATATASLLDGLWHHLACVRRWSGTSESTLELWVDGSLAGSQVSPRRTDMRAAWWASWSGYPAGQEGWFLGAEKQAAIGVLSQYEDYKGKVTELRLWSRARSAAELASSFRNALTGGEPGLVGWWRFGEGAGTRACDAKDAARCIQLYRMKPGSWQ